MSLLKIYKRLQKHLKIQIKKNLTTVPLVILYIKIKKFTNISIINNSTLTNKFLNKNNYIEQKKSNI